jgi:hypothetical protein
VTAFPSLHPIESSTLAPESALFAAELAERISLALKAIATGMHVGSVGVRDAVSELDTLAGEAIALAIRLTAMHTDGTQQLATERQAVGFLAGRRA